MLEELLEIRIDRIDLEQLKRFSDQRHIGAPRELHSPSRFIHPKDFRERAFEGLHTGAAAADQSAVDIKENKFNHAPRSYRSKPQQPVFFLSRRWCGWEGGRIRDGRFQPT